MRIPNLTQNTPVQTDRTNLYDLYQGGLNYLYDNGFLLFPDRMSPTGAHTVYRMGHPKPILGINYPKKWVFYQRLTKQNLAEFCDIVTNCPDEQTADLFSLFLRTTSRSNPLIDCAHLSLNMEDGESFPNYITLKGTSSLDTRTTRTSLDTPQVLKYVPPLEWFDESLRDFSISELFTIFEEPELKLLMLTIGKLVTGENFSTNAEGEQILHTYRAVPLIVGKDAGLGKSTLITTHLAQALTILGYNVTTISTLGQRFGLTRVAQSDFCIFDDLTEKTCNELVTSPQFKSLASNLGFIPCEEKNQTYTVERSKTTVLAITNTFYHGWSYLWDAGQLSRVVLLSTKEKTEMAMDIEDKIRLLQHKYEVPLMTLMIRVVRECADYFAKEQKNLRAVFNDTRPFLKLQFTDNLGVRIFNCLYFCARLFKIETEWTSLDDLERIWSRLLVATLKIKTENPQIWLNNWISNNRDCEHPGWVLQNISGQSLKAAIQMIEKETLGGIRGDYTIPDYEDFIIRIFASLRFQSGLTIRVKRLEIIRDQFLQSLKERPVIDKYLEL